MQFCGDKNKWSLYISSQKYFYYNQLKKKKLQCSLFSNSDNKLHNMTEQDSESSIVDGVKGMTELGKTQLD